MRSILRMMGLVFVLLALVIPLTSYASDGPCPDDPAASQNCDPKVPPFYVVINRTEQHLTDRTGSGCQPWILKHPECTICTQDQVGQQCGGISVETEICGPMLSKRVADNGKDPILYEMCCDCTNPAGTWMFRVREWKADGTCPITQPDEGWLKGLPPGTGIDLPAPLIIGGFVVIGAGLLVAAVLVRRRAARATG